MFSKFPLWNTLILVNMWAIKLFDSREDRQRGMLWNWGQTVTVVRQVKIPFLSPRSLIAVLSYFISFQILCQVLWKAGRGELSSAAWQLAIPLNLLLAPSERDQHWRHPSGQRNLHITTLLTEAEMRAPGVGVLGGALAFIGGRKNWFYDPGIKTLWGMNKVRKQSIWNSSIRCVTCQRTI